MEYSCQEHCPDYVKCLQERDALGTQFASLRNQLGDLGANEKLNAQTAKQLRSLRNTPDVAEARNQLQAAVVGIAEAKSQTLEAIEVTTVAINALAQVNDLRVQFCDTQSPIETEDGLRCASRLAED